jgi:hypothetical protein
MVRENGEKCVGRHGRAVKTAGSTWRARRMASVATRAAALPKQSALPDIASQQHLSDHAASQQVDDSAMVARWDVLLLAAAVAGGSMLIENSHRLDTGAPDDEVVASSTCRDDQVTGYGWNRRMLIDSDEGVDVAGDDADRAQASSGCPAE